MAKTCWLERQKRKLKTVSKYAKLRAELKAALDHAMATRGRFQLLDIRLQPGALSPTLQRFVGAVKRLSMPAV